MGTYMEPSSEQGYTWQRSLQRYTFEIGNNLQDAFLTNLRRSMSCEAERFTISIRYVIFWLKSYSEDGMMS